MGGTVTVAADGTFEYDPPANFAGVDWFSFTVYNGSNCSTATAFINVTNQSPIAYTPAYEIFANQTLTAPSMGYQDLLYYGYDGDADTLTVVGVTADPDNIGEEIETLHGTVTVEADGSFVYHPDTDWTGYDEFTVILSDGIDTVMTVTIHVA